MAVSYSSTAKKNDMHFKSPIKNHLVAVFEPLKGFTIVL